jgi:outer membrane protein assembly factor BamB
VVAISGLPAGVSAIPSSLTLVPGVSQAVLLTAASTAPAQASTVTLTGTSGSLTHNATFALNLQGATSSLSDVTTYHYDRSRSGLNAAESALTVANVNSSQFGKTGFYGTDGKVDAQPLYLANLTISGRSRNVLYVGTEHGTLYAFDADDGTGLWQTSLLGAGENPSDDHGCSQISPEIGISATPVIDRGQGAHGTIFLVVTSKDANGGYHHRFHAVDLTTGADTRPPTEITATYPGTGQNSQGGNVIFDPSQYAERAALLLLNGTIYTGWTSHCDRGVYTGWIMGYDESTLQQTQLLNVTPNGSMGSVWMSGNGLAADSAGSIYALIANGTFDTALDANGFPSHGDYGNSMLRLSVVNDRLTVADYFTMYNTLSESSQDLDLGSGGPLLLPDQVSQGIAHHLIVGAGKDRNIYLADRDNLGKFNPASNPADNNIYQEIQGANLGGSFSSAAYFNGSLYLSADNDALKVYPLTNAKMSATPSSVSATIFPHPGPTPTISANGLQDGIVWALESSTSRQAVLHAYDATNLAHELYNSNQAANGRDNFGVGNKFITPMVVDGKVYVGTPTGVAVFGLLTP